MEKVKGLVPSCGRGPFHFRRAPLPFAGRGVCVCSTSCSHQSSSQCH